MLTDINNFPKNTKTDHNLEKYIFYRKKVKQKMIFSRVQVGFGAGFIISQNGSEDPDPYQNETDPKHCFSVFNFLKAGVSVRTFFYDTDLGFGSASN